VRVDDVLSNIWPDHIARHILGCRLSPYMGSVHVHIHDVVSNIWLGPAWSTTTRAVLTRGRDIQRLTPRRQGLTLVHFSAQLEPFLTQNSP